MNFFFDNNLPPAIARALQALSRSQWGEEHEVQHLTNRFPPDTPDAEWITTLSDEGGWCVITKDRLTKGLERQVLARAGLVVFLLDRSWKNHQFWASSVQLCRWWPRVVEQAERLSGGAILQVPWNVSGKGKFKQVPLA
ncbi:hypothetical protein [Spectribacter acetivorans]|uniref:PIN-like domain-containing protein n=1 Tax=Spectribacter acetivorans TaxID=3075603 RepID=UPI0032C21D0F